MIKKLQSNRNVLKYLRIFILMVCLPLFSGYISAKPIEDINSNLQQQVNSRKTVTLNLNNASIKTILYKIQQQTKLNFVYKDEEMKEFGKRSIKVSNAPVQKVLTQIFANSKYTYRINGNNISIVKITGNNNKSTKKAVEINGHIQDTYKKPIFGAVVTIEGKGTVTDTDGNFKMKVNIGDQITVSYVGMVTVKRDISTADVGKNLIITMTEDVQNVEDIVITGMFNKPKESNTGAVTLITKQELKNFKSRDLLRTIANIDPAFNIVENNKQGSNPNALPEINLRGVTNIPQPLDANAVGDINDLQTEQRAQLNTPLFILDGFEISLERMMDLDEELIENVTVLKDAGSTAIYGSRGSNGVVVITSTKPEAGNLRVGVNVGVTFEVPDLTSYNVLNSREKLDLELKAGLFKAKEGEGLSKQDILDREYYSKLKSVLEGVDTYWLSLPLRVGLNENYSLSLSGGDRSFRYSLSGSYGSVKGVMKGSERNNFNGGLTISYHYKNLDFSNAVSVGINSSHESNYGSFSTYAQLNPYWTPYDDQGNLVLQFRTSAGFDPGDWGYTEFEENPLYDTSTTTENRRNYLNLRNNTNLEWEPIKGIRIGGRIGFSQNTDESHDFKPANHSSFILEKDPTKKGSYHYGTGKSTSYDMALNLSLAKVIGKHSLFFGINGDIRESKNVNYTISAMGFTHERLNFLSLASQYSGKAPAGSESTIRSIGLTATASYNYGGFIFADGSYRLDGASSFGSYSRFKPFYTVGAGFTPTGLNFFKDNVKWLQSMRFRYNYGVTGSLPFQVYEALTTFEYYTEERYDGLLGAQMMSYGNPNLTWQYTYSHNIGTDVSLFKGLVSFGANYYDKKTYGQITSVNLPLTHGYESYKENNGCVRNYGYDFNVSVRLINDNKRQINWSVRASFARNNNVLVELSDAIKAYNKTLEGRNTSNTQGPVYLYREGESMDALYVIPSLGVDPASGIEYFRKRNGRITSQPDPRDKIAMGLTIPKLKGSISTSLRYKRLTATVSFQLKAGGQKYNSTLVSKVDNAYITKNVDRRVLDGRWNRINHYSQYKGLTQKGRVAQSSRFMQNETSINCSSINIQYLLASKWISRNLGVSSINISVNTNDLFQISTIKYERGTSYPFARQIATRISFTF